MSEAVTRLRAALADRYRLEQAVREITTTASLTHPCDAAPSEPHLALRK